MALFNLKQEIPVTNTGLILISTFPLQPIWGRWISWYCRKPRRRWRHFGASGAKLVWGGEAFAVRRGPGR